MNPQPAAAAPYASQQKFLLAVDCVIFGLYEGRLSLLLTRRDFEPCKGVWSLMGGFLTSGETLDEAACRVLGDITGLDDIYLEQLGAFGEIDRDPGGRVISVAYFSLIYVNDDIVAKCRDRKASWFDINVMPPLCFDHEQMISRARSALQAKLAVEPVCFRLLPERFTLRQLQSLYETILGEELDKRNFRKRIADTFCIVKTGDCDKSASRRGANLYTFSEELYHEHPKFRI